MVAGVSQAAEAKERIHEVLGHAVHGALVLLICSNQKVYDAAFVTLNVDLQPSHFQQ